MHDLTPLLACFPPVIFTPSHLNMNQFNFLKPCSISKPTTLATSPGFAKHRQSQRGRIFARVSSGCVVPKTRATGGIHLRSWKRNTGYKWLVLLGWWHRAGSFPSQGHHLGSRLWSHKETGVKSVQGTFPLQKDLTRHFAQTSLAPWEMHTVELCKVTLNEEQSRDKCSWLTDWGRNNTGSCQKVTQGSSFMAPWTKVVRPLPCH